MVLIKYFEYVCVIVHLCNYLETVASATAGKPFVRIAYLIAQTAVSEEYSDINIGLIIMRKQKKLLL